MVILIGGVSCTGKTVMAQRLLEKYHIPYLSIDHIKMGLFRGGKYCDFTPNDGDDEIAEKLWPMIKGIIETNIENGQHIIIEGCYLPPERIRDFGPEYLTHIIALYIGFSKRYIENRHVSGILEHRSEIEQKEYDEYLNRENLLRLHSRLKERCVINHAAYFEIDCDYTAEIGLVYQWIDEQAKLMRG